MNYLVFYAGLLYGEYAATAVVWETIRWDPELYNGAYAYSQKERKWYRLDMTPVLDVDVPKELKAMLLLLT